MPVIPKTFDPAKQRFDKNPNDVFITPYPVAYHSIKWLYDNCLTTDDAFDPYRLPVIDVGCGTGIWGKAVKTVLPDGYLTGVDIVNQLDTDVYNKFIENDYLKVLAPFTKPHLIIGNPPFSSKTNKSLAKDIVLHSLDLLPSGGWLGLLLKTEFKASKERYEELFSVGLAPMFELQMVNRINWGSNKNGNTIEYSFFIWRKDFFNSSTITYWLDWKNDAIDTQDNF